MKKMISVLLMVLFTFALFACADDKTSSSQSDSAESRGASDASGEAALDFSLYVDRLDDSPIAKIISEDDDNDLYFEVSEAY